MPAGRQRATGTAAAPPSGEGWPILSYLLAGMAYGGLGWLIAHWTGLSLLFPLGMLFGLARTIWLVIYRYPVRLTGPSPAFARAHRATSALVRGQGPR